MSIGIARLLLLLGLGAVAARAQAPVWTLLPPIPVVPNATSVSLYDVEAVGPNDAWVVGEYIEPFTPAAGPHRKPLIFHWDGTAWSRETLPTIIPPGGNVPMRHGLRAVAAFSAIDVWAAGDWHHAVGSVGVYGPDALLLHWDGTSWTQVPNPFPPSGTGNNIFDITTGANADVWFGGLSPAPLSASVGVNNAGYLLRHDGSNFTAHVVQHANTGAFCTMFRALSHDGANEVWAVGGDCFGGAPGLANLRYVCRWDGSSWSLQSPPTAGFSQWGYEAVECVGPNEVWVGGYASTGSGASIILQRRLGGVWTTHLAPAGLLEVFTMESLSSTEVLAGGYGGVFRWNGSTWSLETGFPSITPGPFGIKVEDLSRQGQDVWAVIQGANGPVVARRVVPSIPATATPRLPCVGVAPPSSLVSVALPVIGTAAIVGIDDPTNASAFTPMTTQTYWLVSLGGQPNHPCGLPVPGLGLGGAPGELLVDLQPGVFLSATGPLPWFGPGQPALHAGYVPALPALAGLPLYTQGVLVDFGTSPPGGLFTNALDLVLGY